MRTDVKTLIAALTTERNSIDRAIAALRQMSDGVEPAPVVARTKYPNRRRRAVTSYDVATTSAIAFRMMDKHPGVPAYKVAEGLSREFGIPTATILSGWRRWLAKCQTSGPNGDTAPTTHETAFAGAL